MRQSKDDLRDCATAYDCRDRLPELSAWMTDELLKQLPIWKRARFERGQEYFDLDNPERGPFVATAKVLSENSGAVLVRADLHDGADDASLIATATVRLGRNS